LLDYLRVRDRLQALTERLPPGARKKLRERETFMAWTTPTLVEICIGLEINGYLPIEL
jgi:coenzyme PQQ precursor peptide PqqA